MKIRKVLNRRQITEQKFHDELAKTLDIEHLNTDRLFESKTAPESRYAYKQLGNMKGKRILDLGCGNGEASIYFAKKGAKVYAIDISPIMVSLVKKLAKKKNLNKRIVAKVMLAEDLKFPSNYFDLIFGRGVLHHVSIKPSMIEIKRILKKDGVGVFIEPLMHNPIINVYRKIAKEVRTPDEQPINYFKIDKLADIGFTESYHKEFQLTTLLILVWYFLVQRVSPNKERYWDKLIDEEKKVQKPFKVLKFIDDTLFSVFPLLRQYAWYSVMVFRK